MLLYYYVKLLKSSDMVNFYTGIENIDAFNTIFDMVNPIARKRWSGYKKSPKKLTRSFKSMPKRFSPARKLCAKDEMLLCLRSKDLKILLKTFILLLMQVRYSLTQQKILMIRKKPSQNTNIIIL